MSANHRNDSYEVAVIGCGPVGLTLAHLLSAKGIRVAAIDPNRLVCQHPRATHLDDETMRTIQTVGADAMEPQFSRTTGCTMLREDGAPFLILEMLQVETDQGWQSDYMFHQPDFESHLRGSLAAKPNVDLWLGWEVTALKQYEDRVEVGLKEQNNGQVTTVRADYVVGSDGVNSFVRRWIGPEVEDFHATQRSLIVDIFPFEHPEGLSRTGAFIHCRPDMPVTYVPIFPPMLRFEFMLSDAHQAHELENPTSVYELLAQWIRPGTYRIMRTDAYVWHARLVKGWRKGRVLLAGDAAHEMPPMLGQGMCSGLRDALNLAWKLALVVKGVSSDALLDTYETERAPHVLPYIVESGRQANMVETFSKGVGLPPELGKPHVVERFRPLLGPGLTEKPDGAIGQLAPQPRSKDGRRLDDVSGYNFTIVGSPATIDAADNDTRTTWQRLGAVVLSEPGHVVDQWMAAKGADAAIIRPDRYAFALTKGPKDLALATRSLAQRVLHLEAVA